LTQITDWPDDSEPPPASSGRLARTLQRWFMNPARVAAIETISPHFRLVELQGEALCTLDWTVGQKIQVAVGTGLAARTYTPMAWDKVRGTTRFLAFAHGEGPGSRWTRALKRGDDCRFMGPRRSLDLSALGKPALLFGDETGFGLAAALRSTPKADDVMPLFEAFDVAESQQVLDALGLAEARLVPRRDGDRHLARIESEMVSLAQAGAPVVLTGKASSIQRVGRALKAAGIPSSRMKAKAYWAEGKTGLD
jgi:ferric-chelate reductase (NADPH)